MRSTSLRITSTNSPPKMYPTKQHGRPSECDLGVKFLESPRDSPGVGVFILVVQGFDFLLFLLLAEFGGVAEPEKVRGEFDEPLGINGRDLSHVFLGGQHQLMVDNPENKTKPWRMQHKYSVC